MSQEPNQAASQQPDAYSDAVERLEIANDARRLLGLAPSNMLVLERIKEVLPRYRLLAVHVRTALYGIANGLVQHMIERNHRLDEYRAMEQAIKQAARG